MEGGECELHNSNAKTLTVTQYILEQSGLSRPKEPRKDSDRQAWLISTFQFVYMCSVLLCMFVWTA
jgi:hypothetical protein